MSTIITLDGADGVGKTYTSNALVDRLLFLGKRASVVERNYSELEFVRGFCNPNLDVGRRIDLACALFRSQMRRAIKLLNEGSLYVILDRSPLTTYAYQCVLEGASVDSLLDYVQTEWVDALEFADIRSVILDCPVSLRHSRIASRSGSKPQSVASSDSLDYRVFASGFRRFNGENGLFSVHPKTGNTWECAVVASDTCTETICDQILLFASRS
jgi:thymidylate kinase